MHSNLSKLALFTCILVLLCTAFFFYPRWERRGTEATLSWDVSGYYMYLPAVFIYKDIKKCTFHTEILKRYGPTPDFQQAFIHPPSGNYVMKYTLGQALLMLPWFLLGHFWVLMSGGFPADGFSPPYQQVIGIGMLMYAIPGLFFLRKILLRYFSDKTVALTLLILVIGTNYLNYAAIDQGMTHSALFTIYVLIIWNTIQFYESITIKRVLTIGGLCGLATLVRPTEIISLLIPLFWGLNQYKQVPDRLNLIKQNISKAPAFLLAFGLPVFLQLLYWKLAAGEWVVYSYQDQGFSWLHPNVDLYLFSFKCGWLRYCPMMFLSFAGLWALYKYKINRIAVFLVIFLSLYIVTAWDIWDYGGTAGRAMVQYYPILLFPIAALIKSVHDSKYMQWALYPIVLLFAYLNIWWTINAHGGPLQFANADSKYYWNNVGRWPTVEKSPKILESDVKYDGVLHNPEIIYENNFEGDNSENKVLIEGNPMVQLNKKLQFTPLYRIKNNGASKRWVRATAKFNSPELEQDHWKQTQFIVLFYQGEKEIQRSMIRVQNFMTKGVQKALYLDAKCPDKWTELCVSFWNAEGDKPIYIDDVNVVAFDD